MIKRDIMETLAGYIRHPSEYSRLFQNIMIIYKPANTIIIRVCNREILYIYNKPICQLSIRGYGECCRYISCKHNIHNRYSIPYLSIYGNFNIYDINYNKLLCGFDNFILHYTIRYNNCGIITYDIPDNTLTITLSDNIYTVDLNTNRIHITYAN
jgi:hypothetical protein